MPVTNPTTELNQPFSDETLWQVVHEIARSLSQTQHTLEPGKDSVRGELEKTIAYLRRLMAQGQANPISQLLTYLNVLVREGKTIGHGQQTSKYYEVLRDAYKKQLKPLNLDTDTTLLVLSWVVRLMRYYGTMPIGETGRAKRVDDQVPKSKLPKLGDIVEAEVVQIKGKEVFYRLLVNQELPLVSEAKYAKSSTVGQIVKVKITNSKNGLLYKVERMRDEG